MIHSHFVEVNGNWLGLRYLLIGEKKWRRLKKNK